MATTWNPADKTAGVTLSGGDLVATSTTAGQYVRATNPVADFEYFELRTNAAISFFNLPGIATSSFDPSAGPGGGGGGGKGYILIDGAALGSSGNTILYDFGAGSNVATFAGTPAANDVYGYARDGTKLYVSRNGTWVVGNPVAGTGSATIAAGTYYPLALLDGSSGSVSQTLQADTPTYSPPSGYTIIGGGGPAGYTLTADRGTFGLTGQAANFPNLVSKAAYKGAANGSTTATIPSHVSGDLLVAFAFRDGSTTQPTLPAGWTGITTQAGTTCCGRWAWKRAASSSETSGTWTNATELEIAVYSGVDRVGASASQAGTAASVTYPALTMQFGNSWVSASAGHRSINTTLETPPTGMTLRDNRLDATAESAIFDTNGLVTSFTSRSVSVGGTASGWVAGSVELIPQWGGAAGATSYTLVADRGTFTYSGVAAGLRAARKLVSAQGTYALTGQAAGLKRGLRIVSNQGSYSLTGNAAGLLAARKLSASQGTYSLTGIDATLTYTPAAAAYTLTADAGVYTLTGRAVGFNGQRLLSAASGSYSVTGRAATLTYTPAAASYVLTAEAGGYVVTGRNAGLAHVPVTPVTPDMPLYLGGGSTSDPYERDELKAKDRKKLRAIIERAMADPSEEAEPLQELVEPAVTYEGERATVDWGALAGQLDAIARAANAYLAALEQAEADMARQAEALAFEQDEDDVIALLMAA